MPKAREASISQVQAAFRHLLSEPVPVRLSRAVKRTLQVDVAKAHLGSSAEDRTFRISIATLVGSTTFTPSTGRTRVSGLRTGLQRYLDPESGNAIIPEPVSQAADEFVFRLAEPRFDSPDSHLSKSAILKLSEMIECRPMPLHTDPGHEAVITALAHIDGALWPDRPGPTLHQYQVAHHKMQCAPETYRLLTTSKPAGVHGKDTVQVHGYTNFWRAERDHAEHILHDCMEDGNVKGSYSQEKWGGTHAFATPIELDGVFTAVQLAPYLRPAVGSQHVNRPYVRDAIIDTLLADARRRVFYRYVFFRLSHLDEHRYFQDEKRFGRACVWEPRRRSLRESVVRLTLNPWTIATDSLPAADALRQLGDVYKKWRPG